MKTEYTKDSLKVEIDKKGTTLTLAVWPLSFHGSITSKVSTTKEKSTEDNINPQKYTESKFTVQVNFVASTSSKPHFENVEYLFLM